MNCEMKLGILVGEDNWSFFREIFDDVDAHFNTDVFRARTFNTPLLYGRLNRWAFRQQLHSMLHNNDVCFFEWASDLLAPASWLAKDCVVITRLHSFELYEWAPKINWDFVDKIILVSEAMRRRFGELYPDHLHKTEVIYNGVSLSEFNPPKQRSFSLNIGMLCNIKPIKRVYDAILMVHGLRDRGYAPHLHIAGAPEGDFRYAEASHRLVKKLKLDDSVHFYGHVSNTASWLKNIDVFVSNSYWEGHQVALIEAMATGCHCLSHFWDGVEETLPAENLFITEGELQQKIIEYAELSEVERGRRQTMMQTLAQEKFDIDRTKAEIRQAILQSASQVHL